MADRELAAFYREQASRLARHALTVSAPGSRLELMEMAATFQRLAHREDGIAAQAAANTNEEAADESAG